MHIILMNQTHRAPLWPAEPEHLGAGQCEKSGCLGKGNCAALWAIFTAYLHCTAEDLPSVQICSCSSPCNQPWVFHMWVFLLSLSSLQLSVCQQGGCVGGKGKMRDVQRTWSQWNYHPPNFPTLTQRQVTISCLDSGLQQRL